MNHGNRTRVGLGSRIWLGCLLLAAFVPQVMFAPVGGTSFHITSAGGSCGSISAGVQYDSGGWTDYGVNVLSGVMPTSYTNSGFAGLSVRIWVMNGASVRVYGASSVAAAEAHGSDLGWTWDCVAETLVAGGGGFTNGPAAATTNGHSFAHVMWTNNALKGAMFDWGIVQSNSVSFQSGDLRYVAPGQVVDFYATNYGSGGEFFWGDTMGELPGHSSVEGGGYGTWVPNNPGPTSGRTGVGPPTWSGSFTNVTVTGVGGTGTNGLTQGVFQGGTLGIIQGIAGLDMTLERLGSNIVGQLRGMGTNGGAFSNVDDSSIWATNVTDVASSNMAREAWTYMSNLITGGTNLIAAYSNQAAVYSGNASVQDVEDVRTDAASGVNALWSGIAAMASPPGGLPDWGVVTFPEPFGTWDLKDSLSLAVIDTKVTGFRAWFKLLIMWGALIVLITAFLAELRLAIWQALSVPQTNNLGMQLLSTAGAVGGPIGYAAGTAAGHFVKAGTTLAIFVVILFFPSVIIVGIESLFTYLGMNSGWLVTSAASVVTDTPTSVKQVLGQTSNWFPVVPLMAMALNYLLVKLSLDGVVSFACVYLKLAVPT